MMRCVDSTVGRMPTYRPFLHLRECAQRRWHCSSTADTLAFSRG